MLLSTQVKDGDAEGPLEGIEVGEDDTVGLVLIDGFELNVGGLLFVNVGEGLTLGAFDGLAVGAIVVLVPAGAIVALVPVTNCAEGAFDDWALTKASNFKARKTEKRNFVAFIFLFFFVERSSRTN